MAIKAMVEGEVEQKGKSIIKKKILIKFGIPIIAIILIPIIFYAVIFQAAAKIKEGLDKIKESSQNWLESVWFKDGINIKDDDVVSFINDLENSGITMQELGMAADDVTIGENTEVAESNTQDEKKAIKYMKKFLEASVASETIDTHNNGNGIAGCVEIKRHNAQTGQIISPIYYVDINDLDKHEDDSYANYYSIDSNNNVVVILRDEYNGEISYSRKTIDYKSAISQYTVPVMFFVDICLVTQNPEYVYALAQEVIDNTEIDITLQESVTVTKTTSTTVETPTNGESSTSSSSSTSVTTEINPLITTVDELLYKLEQTYTITVSSGGSSHSGTETQHTDDGIISISTSSDTTIYSFTPAVEKDPVIKYNKDDPFPTISKKEFYIPNNGVKEAAYNSVIQGGSMMFGLMDSNMDNDFLEQILKYVLYKLSNIDYGVTELDNSLFSLENFNSVSGNFYGDSLEERIWFALKDAGFSEYAIAGAMGNIGYESGGFTTDAVEIGFNENNGGIGLCQWTNCPRNSGKGRNQQLKNYAASKGTTWRDESTQIEFLLGELGVGPAAEGGYASYNLLANYGYTANSWKNATDITEATKAFLITFERFGPKGYNMALSVLPKKASLAQKYYDMFHGKEKPAGENIQNGSFVQYYQQDYGNIKYGSSNMANCGCGPTSFAMIASTIKGTKITPADAVAWCGNKYYVTGSGTSWAYFEAATIHFGLPGCKSIGKNINAVMQALREGKYIISSQERGIFTGGGHFIVLSGIDSSNKIIVKDPNKNNAINKGYNNRTFTPSEVNASARNYWVFNK